MSPDPPAPRHENARPEDFPIDVVTPRAARKGSTWSAFAFVGAAFAIVTAIGGSVLARAHPHEDAFILFKYARLLAEGHGIAYWPGGPPTEGATDFLWMVSIAAIHAIGLEVATAAVIANALGAAVLVLVAAKRVDGERAPRVLPLVSLAFLFGGPAFAAYLGFGTFFYCAVVGALFERAFRAWTEPHCAPSVLVLGLLASLVRPDGVVLAVPFAVLGAAAAFRSRSLGRYAAWTLGIAAAGGAYFAWRWWYFGLPLPLPLYVKSHGSEPVAIGQFLADPMAAWPGIEPNLAWLSSPAGPLPFVVATIVIVLLARPGERARLGLATGLCLLPGVVFLAALSVARQTQNIGSRFQAPALVLCLLATIATAACVSRGGWKASGTRGRAAVIAALLAVVPGLASSLPVMDRIWSPRSYVDTFAADFGRNLPRERVLALTEAGRLAYWTDARVEDLVGLNTARTALAPVDLAYLTELDPDVVMFYAGPFDLRGIVAGRGAVARLEPGELARSVRPEFRADYERVVERYTRVLTPERAAALVTARFLESMPEYEVYAVRNEGNHSHVYGFRAGLPELPAILEDLRATAGDPPRRMSYREAEAAAR